MPNETIAIVITYLTLDAFGWIYNALIGWAEQKGAKSKGLWQFIDGTTSIQVVIGTLATLIGLYAIDLFVNVEGQMFLLSLGAFICSGVPMVVGSLLRYSKHLSEFFKRRLRDKQ